MYNPWKQIARALYVALLGHRADMHGASSRPCATCHQSAVAIKAYDEQINHERAHRMEPTDIAGSLAMMALVETLRAGKTVEIPSLGITLTKECLGDESRS